MTASVIYSKYTAPFSGSCSAVTVIYRVTAIYMTVIYMFDCSLGISMLF